MSKNSPKQNYNQLIEWLKVRKIVNTNKSKRKSRK